MKNEKNQETTEQGQLSGYTDVRLMAYVHQKNTAIQFPFMILRS